MLAPDLCRLSELGVVAHIYARPVALLVLRGLGHDEFLGFAMLVHLVDRVPKVKLLVVCRTLHFFVSVGVRYTFVFRKVKYK